MNLFSRLFPKAAIVAEAEKRAETVAAELSETKRQLATLWESYHAHEATIKVQRETIDSLKAKLREQVDADLLLVSARIAITILKGHKPAQADIALQQSLMQQQRAYGQYYESAVVQYGSGSMLQALGLGNIFGR